MAKINGKIVAAEGKTISEYLKMEEYREDSIVVEYNLEILPKDAYAETVIKEEDSIEIVQFMGGG